ncbi:MAG TPA: hypothetical protein VIM08_01340 [Arthrobacter sp.]|jgi:hypothetical protein
MTPSSDLRSWASGDYCYEAAVELLLRGFGGRFAGTANPWVCPDRITGKTSVDFASIPNLIDGCSKGEQHFLLFAASLAEGVPIDLAEVIPGLEREAIELIMAAVSHASASHERPALIPDIDGLTQPVTMPPLYPWPGDEPGPGPLRFFSSLRGESLTGRPD